MKRSDKAKAERLERLGKANELVRVIAGCGRQFFRRGDQVAEFRLLPSGRLVWIDSYTRRQVQTGQGQWAGFTEGGTLAALCTALAYYIRQGKSLPPRIFGPWPEWVCGGDLWGYGDDIEQVREAAWRLGIVPAAEVES